MKTKNVGIVEMKGKIAYPDKAPFNPPKHYPELPFKTGVDSTNKVYPLVRELFHRMGLDKSNYGTAKWNPLKDYVKKGGKVILKPNWVYDESQYDIKALISDASILRAVVDYVWIACGKTGRIDILESPIENTNWDNLMRLTQAQATVDYLKKHGCPLTLQDIRTEQFVEKDSLKIFGWRLKTFHRGKRKGTRKGYIDIDLGEKSALHPIRDKAKQMRGIQHWTDTEVQQAHNKTNHKYRIPREMLECDTFINLPKLKTHRKAGVTLTLKNLVGIADKKVWLPHYIEGTPEEGGDEAPTKRQWWVKLIDKYHIFHFFRKFGFSIRPPGVEKLWRKKIEEDLSEHKNVRQANWHGGDTVWRMVYDLNMILLHGDKHGKLHAKQQRKYFAIIDGVISGEKFGPLDSIPKKTGILIGGDDPALVETIATRVMGYHENNIKTLKHINKATYHIGTTNVKGVTISTNNAKWKAITTNPKSVCFNFIPPPGWKGHIEL